MIFPFPDTLMQAAREYLWFLSKGYPQKASLKLVGDKFRLTGEFRQVLYRGVAAEQPARLRQAKIGEVHEGDHILIDTYNVLFTVSNYLLGKHLFLCNDGLLRDAGEMRGRIVNKPQFSRTVSLMLEMLQGWRGITLKHYLDEPVAFSGELATQLNRDMAERGIQGEARVVKSPDRRLMDEKSDAICTSDSAIIDHYGGKVIDLPHMLIKKYFQPEIPRLIQD